MPWRFEMADWDDLDDPFFWRWNRQKPIKVEGGIKAQTKEFGRHWWTERWLHAVEEFGPPRRIARGRSYARKGQVLELKTSAGLISAKVQGSRDVPYEVQIPLNTFTDEQKSLALQEVQARPVFVASLLNGEIHPDAETMLFKKGISLFPEKEEGERANCTCPDSANFCKHIAAIYYLISEELERNPFLLFELRGLPANSLLPRTTTAELFEKREEDPLPSDPDRFWKASRLPEIPMPQEPVSAKQKPAILQRLGMFPFWRGESDFMKTLEAIYRAVRNSNST
jgi:uncharacterized Zn finger protein